MSSYKSLAERARQSKLTSETTASVGVSQCEKISPRISYGNLTGGAVKDDMLGLVADGCGRVGTGWC